jgi:hypothetical protein
VDLSRAQPVLRDADGLSRIEVERSAGRAIINAGQGQTTYTTASVPRSRRTSPHHVSKERDKPWTSGKQPLATLNR